MNVQDKEITGLQQQYCSDNYPRFYGSDYLVGIIFSVVAVLYGTGYHTSFADAMFTANHKYMRNRACDSCYGNSLDSGRQDYCLS